MLLTIDAASKHAFDAFFSCLRSEVAEDNIHVTIVSPGYIRTNLSINAKTGDGGKYGSKLSGFCYINATLHRNFFMTNY